eukprot:scpid102322/ scgid5277/ 
MSGLGLAPEDPIQMGSSDVKSAASSVALEPDARPTVGMTVTRIGAVPVGEVVCWVGGKVVAGVGGKVVTGVGGKVVAGVGGKVVTGVGGKVVAGVVGDVVAEVSGKVVAEV